MFYLPIFFQSIRGQSAISSGINCLPYVAFFAFASTGNGYLIGKKRLLQLFELTSGLLSTAGAALLYSLGAQSSIAQYISYQILLGFGVGLGNQVPMMAVQSYAAPESISSTTGIMLSKYPETVHIIIQVLFP